MSGFLHSPDAFNPINPHGARAKMPEGWKSPLRTPLYRVCVDMKGALKPVAITPGVIKEMADMLCISAQQGIKSGVRSEWANPSVVLCSI